MAGNDMTKGLLIALVMVTCCTKQVFLPPDLTALSGKLWSLGHHWWMVGYLE